MSAYSIARNPLGLIRLGAKPGEEIEQFIANKKKTVRVTNTGGSTAYDVTVVNRFSFDEPGNLLLMRGVVDGTEPSMLAPSATLEIVLDEAEPHKAQELTAFRDGEASFYVYGGVQYRDAFQRLRVGS